MVKKTEGTFSIMRVYTEKEVQELIAERNALAYDVHVMRQEMLQWKEKAMLLELQLKEKENSEENNRVFLVPLI